MNDTCQHIKIKNKILADRDAFTHVVMHVMQSDLVFQAEVKVGKHMKTWGQQCHLDWDDAQLALFCLARVAADTDDVTAS